MNTRVPFPHRFLRRTLATCLVCAAALACGADATAPFETTLVSPETTLVSRPSPFAVDTGPLPAGRLAFTYQPADSTLRVYSVRTDGTELTALSPEGQWADAPTWSPDGSRVAYERSDAGEIWTVRADGTDAMRIATEARSPFWLDDTRVGYACPAGVCVVGADGSSPRTLLARQKTEDTNDDAFRLSPDGTTLAFVRHRGADDVVSSAVYLVSLDGTLERRLDPSAMFEEQRYPSWSPDGKRIAYCDAAAVVVADVSGQERDVVLPAERSLQGFASSGPAWSPSGTQIVLGMDAREFYIAAADGSGPLRRVRVSMPQTRHDWPYDAWSWTPR
jgi:dipeptidyl aminopeptidase/acylaminoacyl peptidase